MKTIKVRCRCENAINFFKDEDYKKKPEPEVIYYAKNKKTGYTIKFKLKSFEKKNMIFSEKEMKKIFKIKTETVGNPQDVGSSPTFQGHNSSRN